MNRLSNASNISVASNRSSIASRSSSILSKPHPSISQLFAAVDDEDSEMVYKLLHAKKVFPNIVNKHGETPLHLASGAGNIDIVSTLCTYKAVLDAMDKRGDTPLYWAARHGHMEAVQHLCSKGANINHQDNTMETALHVSARYDQFEVLSYLCRMGAAVDIKDEHGDTPLLCGTWHGYFGIVECLVDAGSSVTCANNEGETPLHVAAVRGYLPIVKFFCERGANINALDKLGCTPLHLAVRRNRLDVVQYLCQQKCEVDIMNVNGDTALHDSCREGDIDVFLTLLEANCPVHFSNKNNCTPLHLAAKYAHSDIVRHLCIAGADINAVTVEGRTADLLAFESSDRELAALIHHLREEDHLPKYVEDMLPNQAPPSRVKLLVCGATGVGKTELVKSLKCPFLRSIFRKRSSSNVPHMIQQRTHGILIHQAPIPSAGDFSIWDFSGLKSYYVLHEDFLQLRGAVAVVVFKVNDPFEFQLAQLRFWLALLKAKHPVGGGSGSGNIRFAGAEEVKPHVVIVGSFTRLPHVPSEGESVSSVPLNEGEGGSAHLLPPGEIAPTPSSPDGLYDEHPAWLAFETVRKEFGDYFTISEQLFRLDCRLSQTPEMKALRMHLGALRSSILEEQPKTPHFVQQISGALPDWQEEYSSMPALPWVAILEKARQFINPLISEKAMREALLVLHDMGEVVYNSHGPLSNIVIINPMWLGLRVFGPALSPENSIIPQLKSVTGYINLSMLQRVYPELESTSVVNLFEHFQLCTPVDDNRFSFLFPCLIKMEPIHGLWERDPNFTVYAGMRVTCQRTCDIFSPSVFPRIQIRARRAFSHDIEDQELTMWKGGLKCCRGEVEVMLRYPELSKCIEIVVRGTEETRLECYTLVQQFYAIVTDTVSVVNPSTAFMTEVLSAKRLREHRLPMLWYSPMEVFAAERGDGVLQHPELPGQEEHVLDVVCCGCQELMVTTRSAPYTLVSDLPLLTKKELSRQLDPLHPLGRDWCLLSLQLLFTEEVPAIDSSSADEDPEESSPTHRLLTEWERSVRSSVVAVVDALRAIGREDAACTIVKGLSPYSNPSSSVIINIRDVPFTSYLC